MKYLEFTIMIGEVTKLKLLKEIIPGKMKDSKMKDTKMNNRMKSLENKMNKIVNVN